MAATVRLPAVAGRFYPDEPDVLRAEGFVNVDEFDQCELRKMMNGEWTMGTYEM